MTTSAHFLLVSGFQWCATGGKYTLSDAIKVMDKDKVTYAIWYVPVAHDTKYEIDFYAPKVEGAFVVELVQFNKGRRAKAKE